MTGARAQDQIVCSGQIRSPDVRSLFCVIPWIVIIGVCASCQRSRSGQAEVAGIVTLDGDPIPQGSILFIPVDGNPGVTTGGAIEAGRYQLQGDASPTAGWHRVEIRSMRKSGRMVPKPLAAPGEMVEGEEEAVAPQFNLASVLKVELQPGPNEQPFEVKSRPRR